MIGFRWYWDAASLQAIRSMQDRLDDHIEELMNRLCDAFGDAGVEYIKPEVKASGRWPGATGETQRGIDYEVSQRGSTWTINYLGTNMSKTGRRSHNIAHMIDVGNFPASQAMFASTYGYKAFPIAGRAGAVDTYLSVIHGMGHTSPEYPKRFSEKGVYNLHGRADQIAQVHLDWFVRTWI